jgi:CDP-6-deoxy-D-xylo-4-hexulose-3-dehydrase
LLQFVWRPDIPSTDFASNFCIPIILGDEEEKKKVVEKLKENNIEVRPLIAGSMGTQPFFIEKYGFKQKPACKKIDECGFYVPNHPGLEREDIERICKIIKENLAKVFL